MKTFNRQTASNNSTPLSAESLRQSARLLWALSYDSDVIHRENQVLELINLESDIERIVLRDTLGELRSEDVHELEALRERLVGLQTRWKPAIPPALCQGVAV